MNALRRIFRRPSVPETAAFASTLALHYALNRVVPERWLVPASLAGAVTVAAFARLAGATWEDQGLHPRQVPSGFDTGGPAAALIGAITAAGLLFPETRRLYADDRITGQTHDETIYQALVRIPLGTALGEEAIFRGSLPALLARRFPSPVAGVLASGLFGLWHIVPTIDRLHLSPWTRDTGPFHRTVSALAVVSFTSAAGVAFWVLRAASNSVVAPTLAHASANSVALAGGWFAHRMQNEADERAARIRGTPGARSTPPAD